MEPGLVKQLTTILNQENEIYETLSKISNNKTDLIVGGKVNELESIVKMEQALVIKIAKLEDQREKLVDILAGEIGKKPEDITIKELAGSLGIAEASELKQCRERMLKNIHQLKNSNELNSKLIKNSLEFIDFSINMMTSIDSVNNSYGSTGYSGETKKRNLFDMKL